MITRLIAHKLTKEVGDPNITTQVKDTLVNSSNNAAESLYKATMKTIRRRGAAGNFERIGENTKQIFEQLLETCVTASTDEAFVQFSEDALALLARLISPIRLATGGYLIFMQFKTSHHEDDDIGDLLVALIAESEAPQFNENLELQESAILDLDSLKHCARIKLDLLSENAETMITFLAGRNTPEVSRYFIDFIGCDRTTSAKDASSALMARITAWCEEDRVNRDKNQIGQSIWDFWKEHEGSKRGIILEELCNALQPDNPQQLLDYLTDEDSLLTGDLPPIPSSYMKKFANFKYTGNGITLEYARYSWNDKIDYNPDENVVYISEPPEDLIEKIRADKAE